MLRILAALAALSCAVPGDAIAGASCIRAGRTVPDGTAVRLEGQCSGLACEVIQCRDGHWKKQVRRCVLGTDCPPTAPR